MANVTIVSVKTIGTEIDKALEIKRLLEQNGCQVKLLTVNRPLSRTERVQLIVNRRLFRAKRVLQRLNSLRRPPSAREIILEQVQTEIRLRPCDLLIAVGDGEILLRDFDCPKIFFCEAPVAHEEYFTYAARQSFIANDLEWIERIRQEERAIFQVADYVLIAWKSYEHYIRTYCDHLSDLLDKIVTHPGKGWHGCYPQEKRAAYTRPPSIVRLGGLERYFNNMSLLSSLTRMCPYILDVYGSPTPRPEYGLRYKGIMPTTDGLLQYQFGLNTVTKEVLRRNGFSAKVLTYLSYGLPVLFTEWEKFPHELEGCIPYNQENFLDVIEECADEQTWQELSDAAYEQAKELAWDKVLEPFLEVVDQAIT